MDLSKFEIAIPSLEQQQQIVAMKEALERIQSTVKAFERMGSYQDIPKSWRRYEDNWEAPSGQEIREIFHPYSGSQVAKMLGISDARTVRKWIGEESKIPYSTWRLFLIMTGRVI